MSSAGFFLFAAGRVSRKKRRQGSGSNSLVTLRGKPAGTRASFMPSLPQLADSVGLRRADQKFLGEGADLEQAPDLAGHAAQGELAFPLSGGPLGDEEGAKARAADIGDVLQIDDDRAAPRLRHGHQALAEFLRGRAVEPAVGLDNGYAVAHFFHHFHAGFLIVTASPSS